MDLCSTPGCCCFWAYLFRDLSGRDKQWSGSNALQQLYPTLQGTEEEKLTINNYYRKGSSLLKKEGDMKYYKPYIYTSTRKTCQFVHATCNKLQKCRWEKSCSRNKFPRKFSKKETRLKKPESKYNNIRYF